MAVLKSNDKAPRLSRFTLGLRLCEARELKVVTAKQAVRYLETTGHLGSAGEEKAQAGFGELGLKSLVYGGYLNTAKPLIHPLLTLSTPLVTWAPGKPEPDCDAIAWQAQRRWTEPPSPTRIFWVSEKGAAITGRPAPRPRLFQATHEVHMAELALRFLASSLSGTWTWIPEDEVPKPTGRGHRVPDALIHSPHGQQVAIEFLGSYTANRIRTFHRDCAAKSLPYQGW
jgi:hypothetical protein